MLMKRIYSLLALFILVLTASAQTVVKLDFQNNVFGNTATEQVDPLVKEFSGVTMTATKGKGTTAPYLGTAEYRFYKNSTLTFSVNGTITSVKFATVTDAKYNNVAGVTQNGTPLGSDTWTGSAENSVEFVATASQVRLLSVEITYTASASNVAAPTFSLEEKTYTTAQSLALTATAGDNIFYTLNGEVPTTSSTPYTGEISLSEDGVYTVKAIAVNAAGEKSNVASATYTIDLPGVKDALLDCKFQTAGNLEGFTVNTLSQDSVFDVWTAQSYGLRATAYANKKNYAAASWIISPKLDFTGKANINLSFDEYAKFFLHADSIATETELFIRADGGEWEKLTIPTRTSNNGVFAPTGNISLEAYKGKSNVELGFFYKSTAAKAGTWEIKNLLVVADTDNATGVTAVETKTPAQEVIYDLSGRRVQKATRGLYIINGKKTFVK